jgi:hypothetical protein
LNLPLDADRQRAWFEFARKGLTKEDLEIVINQINLGIRKGCRYRAALNFTRLIWKLDTFEEELAEAQALKRNTIPPRTNRQVAVEIIRPKVSAPIERSHARPAGEILKGYIDGLRKAAG